MNIGIFDSGIGGLSIARNYLLDPRVNVLYVADTANMPYGVKNSEHIQQIGDTIINFLLEYNVDLIIVACHTASILAGDTLKKRHKNIPIILMQDTVVDQALATTKNGSIGIMATNATIKSNFYKAAFSARNEKIRLIEQACPTLASSIEQYYDNPQILSSIIASYLYRVITTQVDTLILGCTHYALIKSFIASYVPDLTLISSDETIAQENMGFDYLLSNQESNHTFFVSGNVDSFKKKLDFFLNLWNIKHINYVIRSTNWKVIQRSHNNFQADYQY